MPPACLSKSNAVLAVESTTGQARPLEQHALPDPTGNETHGASSLHVRSAAIKGSFWVIAGYGTTQVLRLGGNLILAWLLFPEAFGLIAIVNVVLHGLEMFSDVGIGPSVIQNPRGDSPEFLNTAWSIQIIRGFALWIGASALAWPIAWLLARNDPTAWALVFLLPVAGLSAALAGFNSTKIFTLNKRLKLRRLTAIGVTSQIIGLIVMIGWALLDRSVWALVAGGITAAGCKMALSHLWTEGHAVRPGWNSECGRELFRFGKWIFLSTALSFVAMHLDKLILGMMLTLGELGVYAIAFAFASSGMHICTKLSDTVLFPVYSHFREDPSAMIRVALQSREVVLWTGAAVCVGFAIGAPPLFRLLYDTRYDGAADIAPWLALYMWTTILLLSMSRIPLALGNSRAMFFSNLFRCSGLLFAVFGYQLASLPGFVVGLSLGPALTHLLLLREIPRRRLKIASQSLRFTLVAVVYGLGVIVLSTWVEQTASVALWISIVATMLAVSLGICGLAILRGIRQPTVEDVTLPG